MTTHLNRIIEIDTDNSQQVRQFIDLPYRLYKDSPEWVPPLLSDTRRMLDRKRHPFYKHSEAAFFLAVDRAGTPTGRLAVLENRNYNTFNQTLSAFFFLFECEQDSESARELFSNAYNWALARGLDEIIGPKGFSALDGLGLLVEGFEYRPAFGIAYNPPYYSSLLESIGFKSQGDMVSGYLSRQNSIFPEKIHQVADRVKERRGLQVKRLNSRRELRSIVPRLKELYNASVEGTPGNVPLTDEEAQSLASQLIWFADPKLIKIITKDDQPVGFLFAYPDISAALQRTGGRFFPFGWIDMFRELKKTNWVNINGAGIIEKYRGLGGTAILFSEMFRTLKESRFEHGDIVQIGVDNQRMLLELRDLGINFYKKHRIFRRELEPI
jgi:hypothetical protein